MRNNTNIYLDLPKKVFSGQLPFALLFLVHDPPDITLENYSKFSISVRHKFNTV